MFNERIGEVLDVSDYISLVLMGYKDVADGEPNYAALDAPTHSRQEPICQTSTTVVVTQQTQDLTLL